MVVTNAKRKKTVDMPDSPPKRVTRARAAKAPEDAPPTKPKTTKITTASAKAATEKKKNAAPAKVAAPAKASKRKTRADDEEVQDSEQPETKEPIVEEQPELKPTKSRGRQQKAVAEDKNGAHEAEAPKMRGRQRAAGVMEVSKPDAPKTRGRAKKVTDEVHAEAEPPISKEEVQPVKKTTRGRAAAAAKPPTAATIRKMAAPPTKKRVKFEEDKDKENIPIETTGPQKSALKATGLKAKPVRKPAVARVTTRGRAATRDNTKKNDESRKDGVMPLSPKKVHQVARSDPISEDELAGEKTPTRALSRSPTKRLMSPVKNVGSVSKLDFGRSTPPTSPAKPVSSSILASPARRPPPSPFKDSLKSSPKKFNDGEDTAHPVLLPSRTPTKASLLQESPKRGMFADSAERPILLPSRSPLKASLLQSPARRPMASPMKAFGGESPEQFREGPLDADLTALPTRFSPVKALKFSPEKLVSSPFRAAKSPEHKFKVHNITYEESKTDEVEDPTESPQGPGSQGTETPTTHPREVQGNSEEAAKTDDAMPGDNARSQVEGGNAIDDAPVQELPVMTVAPAFSIASSALRRVSMDSELSEDELASPQKFYQKTPLRGNGISAQDFATPAVISGSQAQEFSERLSFTPLADQLSAWNASSPEKQGRSRQARGMFSVGGAAVIAAPEDIVSEANTESPTKSSFFDDEMVMRDDEEDATYVVEPVNSEENLAALQVSQDSQASDEYGDENEMPINAGLLRAEQEADHTVTCTPAKVFTPVRVIHRPQEMHTVSKVPLRPSAEDSPLRVSRQRSRSCGGPLAPAKLPKTPRNEHDRNVQPATPVLAPALVPQTPSSGMRLDAETPGRTVRKGVVPDVLKGAVVYVDVHTTEGADASGIFVDLLTQMGARCVKQWNWNPRASLGSSLDSNASPQGSSPDTSKVGITHVVYKDGGKRTLEKVRSSNGVVLCVGVGWVLE